MKLSELEPHWIGLGNWASKSPFYVGFSFLCPHCKVKGACPTCGHFDGKRLAVYFEPPIDPDGVAASFEIPLPANANAHRRTCGETFDTLTIAPSIGFDQIGHWHGSITNGECQP